MTPEQDRDATIRELREELERAWAERRTAVQREEDTAIALKQALHLLAYMAARIV